MNILEGGRLKGRKPGKYDNEIVMVEALEWTKTPPTEIGWYWFLECGCSDPVIIEVTDSENENDPLVESEHSAYWAGPIPYPEQGRP